MKQKTEEETNIDSHLCIVYDKECNAVCNNPLALEPKEQQTKHDSLIFFVCTQIFFNKATKFRMKRKKEEHGEYREAAFTVYTIIKTYESGYMSTHNNIVI